MSDALERDLRAALTERAQSLPAVDAAEWLRQAHRPAPRRRLRGRLRLWSIASTSGAAIGGAIVAAVLLLSSGGSSLVPLAYAGWSAVPKAPTPLELARAMAACVQSAGPLLSTAMKGQRVLTEARGKYVAMLFANGRVTGVCIWEGDGRFAGGGGNGGLFAQGLVPGRDQLERPSDGGGGAPGFPGSRGGELHAWGRAGRDVLAVTLVFSDHTTVRATVKHGWYFAWWPITSRLTSWPTSVRVATPTGTISSPMAGERCRAHPRACVFAQAAR